MNTEMVTKGLNDIGGFIAGRIGIEQARNFMRTIDDALARMKEQQQLIWELQDQVEYLTDKQKEQEAVVKQWTKEIANNQLAHALKDSHEFMSLNEHLENEYKKGIWDGLQIAWNIISEGR